MDSTPTADNRREAQHPVDFPAEEFAARRKRIFDAIGREGHALLQSAPAPRGYVIFRQTNEFFYCCGLETPQSYLLLNGEARTAALYLPERGKAQLGEGASPGVEDVDLVKAITGADAVYGREKLAEHLAGVQVVYTPHAPGELRCATRHDSLRADQMAAQDPWDGQPAREQRFIALLLRSAGCAPRLSARRCGLRARACLNINWVRWPTTSIC
jgi:Xaa-Pro aminopeptidase